MTYIPPRDEIELDLLDIWQQQFKQPQIGMLDTFESLQAKDQHLDAISQAISQKFQRKLDTNTLKTAQNIDAVADILREDVKEVSFSCLVPMRETGTKLPFFCVHGAGGNIMIFQDLCKNLGDNQPFYGLQAQGLDGESEPLTSIEAMASQYLSEIRLVQPQGPYIFGGMCLGGLIAYEMAQQVQAAGEDVALVVLLDARNPSSMLAMDETELADNSALNKIKNKLQQGDLLSTLKRKTGRLATKVVKNTTWAIKEKVGNQFIDKEKRFYKHIWDANAVARKAYVPNPYTGSVLALLAAEAPDGSPRDPKRGWLKLAPQLEVIKVPGRHDTVVREPQVKGLAQSINQRFAQIPSNIKEALNN